MIYLVTGFMRSGTSAMMQSLESGGMKVLKSVDRDSFNTSHSDKYYKPNPKSLYEPSMKEIQSWTWCRNYDEHAIKLVIPFLKTLSVHEYKVIFMRRNPEEIRQSYEAAFGQKLTTAHIENSVKEALIYLKNRRDVLDIFEVNYLDFLNDSKNTLENLKLPINVENAIKVIDRSLYRFQIEKLTFGI